MADMLAPPVETLADLLARLGHVPLERIRLHPAPGTETERDVLTRPGGEKRLCELVDGVLVEKPAGYYESLLAGLLIGFLRRFLDDHDLGIVLGADATLRLAPDLAVEVLSAGNTEAEMRRKLQEYFAAGCRLVWYVPHAERTVHAYTSPTAVRVLREGDVLDGGAVLPGFRLAIREWFERAGTRRDS